MYKIILKYSPNKGENINTLVLLIGLILSSKRYTNSNRKKVQREQ